MRLLAILILTLLLSAIRPHYFMAYLKIIGINYLKLNVSRRLNIITG